MPTGWEKTRVGNLCRRISHTGSYIAESKTYSVLAPLMQYRTSASRMAHRDFDLKASTISDCCCTGDGKPLRLDQDRLDHPLQGLLQTLIGSHRVPEACLATSQSSVSMY